MNEARPAVQLACPYQFVKVAPSLAIRSILGVGWPRPKPPPEYAPKSFQPVSSVISMTMLGLFCCCAAAGKFVAANAATTASEPSRITLVLLMDYSPE